MIKNKNILIIGATSAIAQAVAKIGAAAGDTFFLVGRHAAHLAAIADDLKVRGAKEVWVEACDLNDVEKHQALIDHVIQKLGHIDTVLIAHGTLSDQKACEKNFNFAYDEIKTNLISCISLLTILGNYFEQQRSGSIAVISSVAGDRGRQSNYIYGTAKAGLTTFLQGLRHRLHRAQVNVLTIKPGFVNTPMTKQFKKGLLWATPDVVAVSIVKAIEKKKSEIYVPWFWRYIMCVIKSIPESIFLRSKL